MHGSSGDLLLELGVIIFALGTLSRVANRFAISPIPFYLLIGLFFGKGGIHPLVNSEDFISTAAEIGVILLLLLLGLEYSANELAHNLTVNAAGGVADFALNFTPGFVAGLLLGWEPITAAVLGGVTYVSSSGVIAKTLSDLGRLGNKETPTILSLLVIEDLAMAVYLPIVSGLLMGGGLRHTALLVVVALATVVTILLCALRFGGAISRLINTNNSEVLLLTTMGLALLVAGFADRLHVSAGVGAFLVGIALSGQVAHGAQELLTPLRDLFAAVFFVFFGLSTDLSEIPSVLHIALGLAVVTAITKIFTGKFAARRAGVGKRGQLRAGLALVARGEFSIVIAGLALTQGPESDLGPIAATYVLLLAVAGPMLARIDRKPKNKVIPQAPTA